MPRKLVTFRLQLMVIFRPESRNVFVMFFRVQSAVIHDVLLISASPSSQLSPMFFLSSFRGRVLRM